MRKNLTISLSKKDWQVVRDLAESTDSTYSSVIHRLIEAGTAPVYDSKKIEKYRKLMAPAAEYMAQRAGVLARVTFGPRKSS